MGQDSCPRPWPGVRHEAALLCRIQELRQRTPATRTGRKRPQTLNGPEARLTAKIKNHRADYERYLHLAEAWYNDHSRNGSPEIVEFALFKPGKELAKAE